MQLIKKCTKCSIEKKLSDFMIYNHKVKYDKQEKIICDNCAMDDLLKEEHEFYKAHPQWHTIYPKGCAPWEIIKPLTENEIKERKIKKDKLNEQAKIKLLEKKEQKKQDLIIRRFNKKALHENKKTYLIKDKNNGYYKIGFSNNPKKREKTLQSENPNLQMVKVWSKNIEKELHLKYKEQRIRGEYFNLSNIQVKYICTHY